MRGAVVVKHYTGGTWVDSTNGILQVDITRGIPQYDGCWSQVEPGQLTLRSRDLSLASLALQIRIRIEVDGTSIFTGKVVDISTEYVPKEDSIVTLIAFDELAALALKKYQHPTTIAHDYETREIANQVTLATVLAGYTYEPGDNYYQHQAQGYYKDAWPTGYGLQYPTQNTDYGISGFNPPAPPAGGASDTNWGPYLGDSDGLIIANPAANSGPAIADAGYGWGRLSGQTWSSNTNRILGFPQPMSYNKIRSELVNITSLRAVSRSGVQDTGHPLYNSTGFWKSYYKLSAAEPTLLGNYAALMTTNDTDMLTLFLKAEQSEAGFAYVDAKNRFRIYSRAVVDNDPHLSKATFASNGTGISYNNIKVTNGWEGVVNGVTVRNTWSDNFINFYNIGPWGYPWPPSTTEYTIPLTTNRAGTTSTVTFNPATAPTTGKPKDYEWLDYNTTENQYRWVKYAKTNNAVTPIWNVNTRNPELNQLTTKDYFQGKQGLGTKQLILNTNYAFNLNTGAGYLWNKSGTTKAFDRATDEELPDYNVIERSAELADYILTNYSNPVQDIRAINFDVHPSDLDTIKAIDIYDRIDIDHDYAGFVRDKQYCVMGITHSITPNSWNVTYQLWNQDGRP